MVEMEVVEPHLTLHILSLHNQFLVPEKFYFFVFLFRCPVTSLSYTLILMCSHIHNMTRLIIIGADTNSVNLVI